MLIPRVPDYSRGVGGLAAVGNTALNVVCNQEYAQVVPHVRFTYLYLYCTVPELIAQQVHYHIVPAPRFNSSPTSSGPRDTNQIPSPTAKDMHRKEYESRDELDEDDAYALVDRIKAHL